MADLHYREKLKQIEQAASSNAVSKDAKNIGMGCFIFAFFLLIVFLLFLSVSLWINKIIVGALLTGILVIICIFVLYKLWTAPKIP
ncbi:hypothetical protein SAMN05518871_104120 [Psychrobacillus sp. OK028]|uniref:hypothetical protein n=1 Tax=Psychrobacillus sp. OK028 TaxID=1884359 RepID=UPI0008909D2E|nr:hypothetical protein [Psychrobacillus sp. OK028]SDN26486.1 hypothetical protein SAMN05518871_104120 [Psychrobacillus sp. OK028]